VDVFGLSGGKHKNSKDATGNFELYIVYESDAPDAEVLKVGKANSDDVRANGRNAREATSERLARKDSRYPNAVAKPLRNLGQTTTGKAERVEAKEVRTRRNAGMKLPLNKEKRKMYQANSLRKKKGH